MKNVKKVIIGLFMIFLFFPFFSPDVIGATTIGDTTFSADVGETYKWKATHPADSEGFKFTFKSDSIVQSVNYMEVYCTMRVYYPISGWHTYIENELYMVANNTLNYLSLHNYMGGPIVIPTPINLTLVAETQSASSYSIVDNTVFINTSFGESYEYTYNTDGFLTIAIQKEEGYPDFRFVLDTGGDSAIPFGNFFLIFIVISVIALVYLKKRKIK